MTKPQEALNHVEALHLMDFKTKLTQVITIVDNSRTCIQFIFPKSYAVQNFCSTLGQEICRKAVIKTSADIFDGALMRKDLIVYVFYFPSDFWEQYFIARRLLQLIQEMALYEKSSEASFVHPDFEVCKQKARDIELAPVILALPTATGKTLGEYL